ncbi:MAG: penicillin acylase family protein, partial [Bacteroidia bacterium]|nr:penicillin acylase family protein [Bacteroidia bacterium]
LRMDQSKTFEEFREACNYSHIPGENMIWADKDNNIGWQAVGIAPIRNTHSGMVPVPGDGSHEWDGYLEIRKRPNLYNPAEGYFATANQDVTDPSFEHMNTHYYLWSDPYRGGRIKEFFDARTKLTFEEMIALQTDYKSTSANYLLPQLFEFSFIDPEINRLAIDLKSWDRVLSRDSRLAAIYAMWEANLRRKVSEVMIPEVAQEYMSQIQLKRVIDIVNDPVRWKFPGGAAAMQELLKSSFEEAIEYLHDRLGDDVAVWTYGDDDFKHILMRHPLSTALDESMKPTFEVGPLPRGGNAYTVGSTGGAWNQPSGASFKVIINTGNWDSSVAMNAPGQAGDPREPHYQDLFEMWGNDKYFPLFYTREKVEAATTERIRLRPEN